MIENSLKRKLEAGEVTIGPFVNCSYPAFTEILGLAGFDFCILDMEHGPLHTLVLEDLVRAAHVVVLARNAFGSRFPDEDSEYVRFSYVTDKESINKGLDRIENWLNQ